MLIAAHGKAQQAPLTVDTFPRSAITGFGSETSTDTVTGVVRWVGAIPPAEPFEVNADERLCAPGGELRNDRVDVDPVTRAVRNAVVWLEPVGGDDLNTTPTPHGGFRPFRMELKRCQFQPTVLVKPQDSRVWIYSQDDVLHQLVLKPPYGAERRAVLGFRGAYKDWRLTVPGVYHLTCSRHPWEKGAVVVAEHAWYTVTNELGGFSFEDVPPGRYRVMAWHDGMRAEKKVYAGLVTGYRFSDPVQTEGRVRVPEDTARPLQLRLQE